MGGIQADTALEWLIETAISLRSKSPRWDSDGLQEVGCQSKIGRRVAAPRCPAVDFRFRAFTDNQRLTKAYQRLTEALSTTYVTI